MNSLKKFLVYTYILPVYMAEEKGKPPSIIALSLQAVIAYTVYYFATFLALPLMLWLAISGSLHFLKNR
jgi:hypothetical protein